MIFLILSMYILAETIYAIRKKDAGALTRVGIAVIIAAVIAAATS